MKRLCKDVDITDRGLISKAVYACLSKKYKRNDVVKYLSQVSGIKQEYIRCIYYRYGKSAMYPFTEIAISEIQAEIKRLQEENEKKQQAANGGNATTFTDGRFIRPTGSGYYISSGYGARWGSTHTGIDITAGGCYGDNIYAAASGTVITASYHWSYGNYVVIDHGGGYSTLYAHASSLLVSAGQQVSQGDVIARIGSTGQSTGPHLHFEVRINGNTQNPLNWVSY